MGSTTQDFAKEGCTSKRMGESDLMKENTMELEEELCRALSNFSITLNDFSIKKQLIKPPKLQVPSEKFHAEQALPDDDPIPDDPNQLNEVVVEETVRNNSDSLAHLVVGEKNWALKQTKLPWMWKGKEESAEEMQKEEKKEDEEEEKEKKVPWSLFPLEREPLHVDDEETEGSSDEESDDSGFDTALEEEEATGKKEKISQLGPVLGLSLGCALLGGSLGYCRARLGSWLSTVVAKKVVKGSASAIPSEPSLVAGIIGIGLFTWGAVNLCKESSCNKETEEE